MTSVELHQIFQAFAGHPVLCGLDLRIDSGEYVVLLGSSGCGKTTTLRIIAGLQSPDQGEVLLGGKSANGIAPRDRDVAMVFQHDGLYPHLTIAQSLRFALKGRVNANEMRSRLDEAVGLTQIGAILDRYPSRLSGGELRRAAVAKAIARRSSVRLLDEPLSALDIPVRHALQDDILRWHSTVPGTSIHVTHDGQEAMRMADKIAVMEAGQIVQFGTPIEVFTKPQTVSVAKAIGSPPIHLFPAKLVEGKIECRNPNIRVQTSFRSGDSDRELLIGVRPDSFRVDREDRTTAGEPGSDCLVVEGQWLRSRPVQRDIHVDLQVHSDSILAIMPSETLPPAQTIRLTAAQRDVHFFDAGNGLRIEAAAGG